jgi:hypothetical protein
MVCVKLNTDFETAHLDGHELSALVSAWQAGAISRDTLLHNLRQGEILPPGRSDQQEASLISTERNFLQKVAKDAKVLPDGQIIVRARLSDSTLRLCPTRQQRAQAPTGDEQQNAGDNTDCSRC